MSSERPKLQHRTEEEQHSVRLETSAKSQSLEFSSVEEILRYDSEQNPVPPEVGDKLRQSIAAEPRTKSWFERFFRR